MRESNMYYEYSMNTIFKIHPPQNFRFPEKFENLEEFLFSSKLASQFRDKPTTQKEQLS